MKQHEKNSNGVKHSVFLYGYDVVIVTTSGTMQQKINKCNAI